MMIGLGRLAIRYCVTLEILLIVYVAYLSILVGLSASQLSVVLELADYHGLVGCASTTPSLTFLVLSSVVCAVSAIAIRRKRYSVGLCSIAIVAVLQTGLCTAYVLGVNRTLQMFDSWTIVYTGNKPSDADLEACIGVGKVISLFRNGESQLIITSLNEAKRQKLIECLISRGFDVRAKS